MSVTHTFVSTFADGSDATKLRPSDWNANHTFSGGALGSILYRDTGAGDGASWLADVAVGQVLVSGGVGAAPAWSATPTVTALAGAGTVAATGLIRGANNVALITARNAANTADLTVLATTNADLISLHGGAVTIVSNGTLNAINLVASAGGKIYWGTGQVQLVSPASGQVNLFSAGQATGVGFDVLTDGVLKLRTTAQSAYATLDVLGLKASGAAGVSFNGAVTNLTVVNGIVTAAS